MIVFLFQCHPRRLQEHAHTLLPLMVQVILYIFCVLRDISVLRDINHFHLVRAGRLDAWSCTV